MSLTPESGQREAAKRAIASTALYTQAKRIYGRMLDPYLGDAPKGLGLAHLVRVNPKLAAPVPSRDKRRGFMFATISMANTAGVKWESLDDTLVCAYVWGRDINADTKSLYHTQTSRFPVIGEDLWKCSYLKHVFGNNAFSAIWDQRDLTQETVYDSLLYAVNNMTRSLPGMTIPKQRSLAMLECPYVFEMAKRGGGMRPYGYGIEPVLNQANFQKVFS
jgi:hypothetical protein